MNMHSPAVLIPFVTDNKMGYPLTMSSRWLPALGFLSLIVGLAGTVLTFTTNGMTALVVWCISELYET